jgi:hypothetical protein
MAKKDLAGLAALGALGYMMSKGKGGDEAPAPVEDRTGVSPSTTQTNSNVLSAINQNMNDTGEGTGGSTPSAPAATRSTRSAPSNPNYGNEGRRSVREPGPTAYETPYDRMNRKNAEAAQAKADADAETRKLASAHPAPGRGVINTSRINPNTLLPYKKGGAVKSKVSAPKASSASRRADGIASKGKTRGRLL